MKLLTNAKIFTMDAQNRVIPNGFVAIEGQKIASVGSMDRLSPGDYETCDLSGKVILPGLVDAHSHIGMVGDGLGFEADDLNEITDPVQPQLCALDAVNPLDRCFSEALSAGITTVVTGPGSANAIGGSFIALKTLGRRADDMLIKCPVSIKFALGENPKCCYHPKEDAPETRMSTAALIREQLQKAKRYLESLEQYENSPDKEDLERPEFDAKCEALLPLLKGEVPAHIHAHRADDIFTAIRIAKAFNIKYRLVHCTEGHMIADILAKEGCGVFLGPVIGDRSKPELVNASPKTAGILSSHGIKVAIVTDHPELPAQYLLLSAEVACRCGMDYMESLRAVTINAAQLAGIDDRVGSVEPGKDADFAIFDGKISYHSISKVMINGEFAAVSTPYTGNTDF